MSRVVVPSRKRCVGEMVSHRPPRLSGALCDVREGGYRKFLESHTPDRAERRM